MPSGTQGATMSDDPRRPLAAPLVQGGDLGGAASVAAGAPIAVALRGLRAHGGRGGAGRAVLKGLDVYIHGGTFCAVMGPSGSGKTSLIKGLCGVASTLTLSGEGALCAEGCKNPNVHAIGNNGAAALPSIGYLPQEDDLLAALTVRETLRFSAALRRIVGANAVADALLGHLGLARCARTRVGTPGSGGISGGERRRVSLGIRLLQRPALLCADEPTSGLDSANAKVVVELLRKETEHSCTVVCSIHQPRQEIFDMFEHLLLLSDGQLVYSGPPAGAVTRIEGCTGLSCPRTSNPADFIIDACALDRTNPERFAASSRRIGQLVADQQRRARDERVAGEIAHAIQQGIALFPDGRARASRGRGLPRNDGQRCGVVQETWTLTRRAFVCVFRDRLMLMAVSMQGLIFGVMFGYMDFQLSTETLPDIHSRIALIYITPALSGYFVMSATLYMLSTQVAFFDNERLRDNLYTPTALVFSQFLALLPLNILAPLPIVVTMYLLSGLRLDVVWAPLIFYALLVLNRIHCTALAILFIAINPLRVYALSSVFGSIFFLCSVFTGGFLTPVASLRSALSWFRWFAYTFWSFRWNLSAQFSDFTLEMGVPGRVILDQYGIKEHDFTVPPVCSLGLTVLWLFLSVLAFASIRPLPPSPKAVGDSDAAPPSGSSAASPNASPCASYAGLHVALCGVSLEMPVSRWRRRRGQETTPTISVLTDVSAEFAPGQLSVVMGASGAGKTTLLSVVAGRLGGAGSANGWKLTGDVRLDGSGASPAKLLQTVAFVAQHDNHLPGLTAREALDFYARLRLAHLPREEQRRRACSYAQALGLDGCLGNRIGTQAKGGISGGERRRLSVAMACLGEPGVLLLDEPTTGLDALAAQQLVHLLRGLVAERGQTIVFTIHQPRSDLLPSFDNILLLGPGGRVLLDGPPNGLRSCLTASGASVPVQGNILDFAMDLVADPVWGDRLHERWRSQLEAAAQAAAGSPDVPPHAASAGRGLQRRCPWHKAMRTLMARSLLNFSRQIGMVWARCMQIMLWAVVLVPVYAPIGNSQNSITSRIGLLYQCLGMLFAGTLNNIAVFPIERDVFLRESVDGLYSTAPFFLVYSCIELVQEAVTAFVQSIIIVQIIGLVGDIQAQFVFFAVMVACLFNGETLGITLNSATVHAGASLNLINSLCAVLQIISGFMANDLPAPLVAINKISPQMHACRALAVSQFPPDLKFGCDPSSPICIRSGSDVLRMLAMDGDGDVRSNLIYLAVLCLFYRFVSFLALHYRARKFGRM